jgi:hypothetical protein
MLWDCPYGLGSGFSKLPNLPNNTAYPLGGTQNLTEICVELHVEN